MDAVDVLQNLSVIFSQRNWDTKRCAYVRHSDVTLNFVLSSTLRIWPSVASSSTFTSFKPFILWMATNAIIIQCTLGRRDECAACLCYLREQRKTARFLHEILTKIVGIGEITSRICLTIIQKSQNCLGGTSNKKIIFGSFQGQKRKIQTRKSYRREME